MSVWVSYVLRGGTDHSDHPTIDEERKTCINKGDGSYIVPKKRSVPYKTMFLRKLIKAKHYRAMRKGDVCKFVAVGLPLVHSFGEHPDRRCQKWQSEHMTRTHDKITANSSRTEALSSTLDTEISCDIGRMIRWDNSQSLNTSRLDRLIVHSWDLSVR